MIAGKLRFLLISAVPATIDDQQAYVFLKELKSLVDTYGGDVVNWIIQHRDYHDKGGFIGKGKIAESSEIIRENKVDIVVLNAALKSSEVFEFKKEFVKSNCNIEVWDRVDLILQIFARHANTTEARLQIEIAAMRHMGPRIYGMGFELSRQRGGIGARGIGETNTERMRRHWRDQMKLRKDKLVKLVAYRQRQMEIRKRNNIPTVSIVGYTNAGKTSLFNLLTGKKKLSRDILFATLDSAVGKMRLPLSHKTVLVSDTIGFIQNLPTDLIDAFKSTLMESINADLLLHVIDASDEDMQHKIATVKRILFELRIQHKPQIYVFNKMDLAVFDKKTMMSSYARFHPQFISVKTGEGIDELKQIIEKELDGHFV